MLLLYPLKQRNTNRHIRAPFLTCQNVLSDQQVNQKKITTSEETANHTSSCIFLECEEKGRHNWGIFLLHAQVEKQGSITVGKYFFNKRREISYPQAAI